MTNQQFLLQYCNIQCSSGPKLIFFKDPFAALSFFRSKNRFLFKSLTITSMHEKNYFSTIYIKSQKS